LDGRELAYAAIPLSKSALMNADFAIENTKAESVDISQFLANG